MAQNGNHIMDEDYFQKMQTYLARAKPSTKIEENTQAKVITKVEDAPENSQSVDKDELFKYFMMFMNNNQNSIKKDNVNVNPSIQGTNDTGKTENRDTEKTQNVKEEDTKKSMLMDNQALLENNVFDDEQFENDKLSQEKEDMNNSYRDDQTNPPEVKTFDDIPIKPKSQNFLELLENNLANEDYEVPENPNTILPKREYKPRPKRTDKYNISQPKETKKYKYYSQNFDKNFGATVETDIVEKVVKTEKEASQQKISSNKKAQVKKYSAKHPTTSKDRINKGVISNDQIKAHDNDDMDAPINSSSSAKPYIKQNLKGSTTKKEKKEKSNNESNSNTLWSDYKGISNDIECENDFLTSSNPRSEGKKIDKGKGKTSASSSSNVNNPNAILSNQNSTSASRPAVSSPLNQDIEDVIQMRSVAPMSKTGSKLDPVTEQVIKNKKESILAIKSNQNIIANDQGERIDNEGNYDDNDDRMIFKLYEQKLENNNSPNAISDFSSKVASMQTNSDAALYKKPEQSKIINKYFKPFLKTTPQAQEKYPAELGLVTPQNNSSNNENLNEILNEKITALNKEIEKFQRENEKASKLKAEYEKLTKKLNKEIEEFSIQKEKELQDLEKTKEEEMKKIERDKKVAIRNSKLIQNMPNRKEREEIDMLKDQVLKLQEEMKAKDQRNRLAMDRVKKQLEDTIKKNEDLQREIKLYEEMRIKNMLGTENKAQSTSNLTKVYKSKQSNSSSVASTNVGNANAASTQSPVPELKANKSTKNLVSGNSCTANPVISNSIKGEKAVKNLYSTNNEKLKPKGLIDGENISDEEEGNNNENEDNYSNKQIDSDFKYIQNTPNYGNMNIKANKNIINSNNPLNSNIPNSTSDQIKMSKAKINCTNIKEEQMINNIPKGKLVPTNESVSKSEPRQKKIKNEEFENDEENSETFEMIFTEKYHGKTAKNIRLVKQEFTDDGKIIKLFENNKKEVIFPSGVRKEIFEDGYQVTYFNNKDIKQAYPDMREVYLFAENKTIQFKFPSGMQVFKFESGQIEKNFPDGTKIVQYPDGTIRNVYPDGYEEIFFPDGSLQKVDKSGVITVDYEDGIKDTIYPDGTKMREFPDGRIRKIKADGTMENYIK